MQSGKKMAAVAAEPGAAAVATASTTTAGDGLEYDTEPGEHAAGLEPHSTANFAPEMDVCDRAGSVDAAEERSQIRVQMRRPEVRAAGNAVCTRAQDGHTDTDPNPDHMLTDCSHAHGRDAEERLKEPFSPNEVSTHESRSSACVSPPSTGSDAPAPAAVLLHSVPARSLHTTEPGLSLANATEPTLEGRANPESVHPADLERSSEPETLADAPGSDFNPTEGAFHESSDIPECTLEEISLGESVAQSCTSDSCTVSSKDSTEPLISEPEDACLQHGSSLTTEPRDSQVPEHKMQPIHGLVPGTEVRVSLDHIIDDALVVSFRLGEKIFSGVLMDLSKRFGPYGIPITVFPKREYKDKPESMQLKTEAFPLETEKGDAPGTPEVLPKEPVQGASEAQPSPKPEPNPWTSKLPPLFQEGAPYPPPLFIRDTYNQSLPQPPPRKIKRPKRRLYREEPTSIMNAIKLRPRQVLCDKCKGAVVQGDKRETRRGPISDCRSDDAKRRRNDSTAPAAGKRPRNETRSEDRSRSADVTKRQAAAIRITSSSASSNLAQSQVKGAAAGNRVMKGVSATALSNSSTRVQLGAKKVLQSKNVDHSKAREVLKMAKAQKRQRETVTGSSTNAKAMTRAAALQEAHQKVHFTRRLQQISGGPGMSNPLPPRMRIKPQSVAALKGC